MLILAVGNTGHLLTGITPFFAPIVTWHFPSSPSDISAISNDEETVWDCEICQENVTVSLGPKISEKENTVVSLDPEKSVKENIAVSLGPTLGTRHSLDSNDSLVGGSDK
ncbi:hypothetical protein STEG23_023458, partial [Scotinomys teguina]